MSDGFNHGPFDPDELVRWAETYGDPEQWAKRAQQLCGDVEELRAVLAGLDPGGCREWLAKGETWDVGRRCDRPSAFVLWGSLLNREALGPRCYDCAAKHVGHRALGDPSCSVDLRPLRRALRRAAREAAKDAG